MVSPRLVVGRYLLYEIVGSGGMAEVYAGRLVGAAGFSRVVAIKRIHPALVDAPDVTTMLVDEARVASRIRHPNVIPILDVVDDKELLVVMEYVHGLSLSQLVRLAGSHGGVPTAVAVRIMLDALAGLHAAHEARSERGTWLAIVHRDVSPQNVLVGADGIARLLDFGIAKAVGKAALTRAGRIRGKLGYMAPEQLRAGEVDRRTDVYSAGVVLWELLTGRRLFEPAGDDVLEAIAEAEALVVPPPSRLAEVDAALDAVVVRATQRDPSLRFASAEEMAAGLETASPPDPANVVTAFVTAIARDWLDARAAMIAEIEQRSVSLGSDGRAAAHVTSIPLTEPSVPSTTPMAIATAPVPTAGIPETVIPSTEPVVVRTATLPPIAAPVVTAPLPREEEPVPRAPPIAAKTLSSLGPDLPPPEGAPEPASASPSPSRRMRVVVFVGLLVTVATVLGFAILRAEHARVIERRGPAAGSVEPGGAAPNASGRTPRAGRRRRVE